MLRALEQCDSRTGTHGAAAVLWDDRLRRDQISEGRLTESL